MSVKVGLRNALEMHIYLDLSSAWMALRFDKCYLLLSDCTVLHAYKKSQLGHI